MKSKAKKQGKRQPNKVVRKSSKMVLEMRQLMLRAQRRNPRVTAKKLSQLAAFCESKGYGFSILSEDK